MKLRFTMPSAEKLTAFLKQYKFVLILIAAGIILLLLPTGDSGRQQAYTAGMVGGEEDFSVEALEEKLGRILSKVDGAGEVTVMLTVRTGMERVLATDRDSSESDDKSSLREETVIISTGSGEEAVLITQRYPTFQGALVVCRGGDDPQVQLLLTRALSALTGLSSSRITVCKGS
ncbi:MAG: stage III sporulation protein AG [Candidatus Enterenecus sp.]